MWEVGSQEYSFYESTEAQRAPPPACRRDDGVHTGEQLANRAETLLNLPMLVRSSLVSNASFLIVVTLNKGEIQCRFTWTSITKSRV
jgi:hypothetical protein